MRGSRHETDAVPFGQKESPSLSRRLPQPDQAGRVLLTVGKGHDNVKGELLGDAEPRQQAGRTINRKLAELTGGIGPKRGNGTRLGCYNTYIALRHVRPGRETVSGYAN